jgi:hypothetical protein
MQTSPREELFKMQRKLWLRNRDIIRNSIVVKEPGFAAYEKNYTRAVARYERVATTGEMLEAIKAAQVIYIGDYHTCNQSQRSFLRILKSIVPGDDKVVLGLELIHKRHQRFVDEFLADRITEETFLKKIGLRQHWVFDLWANFKPLFDFAKYHGLPTFGIDAAGARASLKGRDEATARLVAHLAARHPGHKIFIMIGDLHLAHLPDMVQKYAKGRVKDLILFQNSEDIYWDLARQDLEHRVEVVKIDDRAFCRMHTPPVVSQQSYINWLEHEEGEIDFSDSKSSFLEMVDHIAKFLDIDLKEERDKVDVYTCGDLSFFEQLKEGGKFTPKELKALKRQILSSESYFIAEKRVVYLANISINHAAEEAAHFIKHVCSGKERGRTHVDAFFANILHEGLAFFGSKLINPKRKCFHEREFEGLFAFFNSVRVPQDRRVEFETTCIVLDFLKNGRAPRSLRPDLFFSVTHALGYMIGDRLFYAMMGERVTKEEIRTLFQDPWKKEGEAEDAYFNLKKKLKGVKTPKRM